MSIGPRLASNVRLVMHQSHFVTRSDVSGIGQHVVPRGSIGDELQMS
jgi:hypothetical protein